MEHIRLGATGIKISKLVLGTMQFGWRIEKEDSFKVMDRAVELGINCFDTADIYTRWSELSYAGKTEEIIGDWMSDRENRDDLVLATKLRGPMSDSINDQGLSRRHIHQAINGSLTRLDTDYIDLYQIHSSDPNTPIEETLHGLNILIDQGVVNYIGASNMMPSQFMESLWKADKYGYQRFETLQPVYNLSRRLGLELEFADIIRKYNIGVIPYSPLAGGFFAGTYKKGEDGPDSPRKQGIETRYFNDKNWAILDKVTEIAKNHDMKVSQVALAWLMSKDFITAPIIGANSVEQLEENLGALELKLNEDELKQLDEVSDWKTSYEEIR
jgi:aryl-alcohol dehydrogenase-like predicted oxidoreductase